MAISMNFTPRYQWQGLSSDTKPTGNTVDVNQLFFETDTGNLFIYNGSAWNAYNVGGGGGGGGGNAPAFKSSVTDTTPGASVNNYTPAGYTGGTTNRLLITAAGGGTTITGLVAATDGWVVLIRNVSATDALIFPHQSGSSTAANRFSNISGGSVQIPAFGAAYANYIVNVWVFA